MAQSNFSVTTLYFPCTDIPTPPPIAFPVEGKNILLINFHKYNGEKVPSIRVM